jgi:hypothetical protein
MLTHSFIGYSFLLFLLLILDDCIADLAVKERRSELYDRMSRDLDEKGAVFLQGGETSQSLSLSDIFELRDGVVVPTPKV